MITIPVETAEGTIHLKYENYAEAIKKVGAANLYVLRCWTSSLETLADYEKPAPVSQGVEGTR